MVEQFNLMRATSNHGHVGTEWYAHPNAGYPTVAMSNHGHKGTEDYARGNVGYPTTAKFVPGTILGYSKDGFPVRAASVGVGSILGYSKDGYPIRAASKSVVDDIVCGGSTALFVVIGLAVGFLAADKIASYLMSKR